VLPLSGNRIGFALGLGALLLLPDPWSGSPLAADKPDLVVTSISSPPELLLPGDTFDVQVEVKNQGPGAAIHNTLTEIETKFYLVVGNTRKNLKGVSAVALPVPANDVRTANLAISVYSDTVPGTYSLQACADGGGDISETVESNNCTTAAGLVTIEEVPDLIISSISNPPSSGAQGQAITVKDTVKNVGPVIADPSLTKYYLVSVADGSRQDLKLPNPPNQTPVLKSGQTFNEQQSVTIRPETAPGQYKLQACADGTRVEPEEDEENNCKTSSGNITVIAVPDLAVLSVSVQDAALAVTAGGSLTVSAVVTNEGLAPAKSSTMKFILVNTAGGAQKNLNGTQSIPALAPGESATVQKKVAVYSDTASGTYTVQACADSGKVVAETSEGNNCGDSTDTVTVQGLVVSDADLVVASVALADGQPADRHPGDPISITAVITNQGTDVAAASTTSFYLINTATSARKNLKGGQNVGALDPGASGGGLASGITLYSDTAPGTYALQACADGPKKLAEANENNNCTTNAAATINVLQVPNLVVSSIGNPPSQAPLLGTFKVTAAVKNLGGIQAGASSTKLYLVSSSDGSRKDLKGTQTVPALNPNQSYTEQVTLTVRIETVPGTYRVQACADGGRAVAEGNEDDNCKTSSGTIRVTGQPDLVVTSLTVRNAPITVARGGSLVATTGVKNVGEGDALAVSLKFLLVNGPNGASKNLNGTQAVAALRSGASTTYSKTVTVFKDTPVGTYNVQACIDSTDIVAEASEINNCLTTETTVTVE
jgi:subtilase family serine protease